MLPALGYIIISVNMIGLERFCYQFDTSCIVTPVYSGTETLPIHLIIKEVKSTTEKVTEDKTDSFYSNYNDSVDSLSKSLLFINKSNSDEEVKNPHLFNFSDYIVNGFLPFCFVSSIEIKCIIYFFDEKNSLIRSFEINSNTNYFLKIPEKAVSIKYSFIIPPKNKITVHFVTFNLFDFRSNLIIKSKDKDVYFRFEVSEPSESEVIVKRSIRNLIRGKILNSKKEESKIKKTVIFLPSAFVSNAASNNQNYVIAPFPYFSRGTWYNYLPDYLSICVADPLMFMSGCNVGSWMFDSNTGDSFLPELSDLIKMICGKVYTPEDNNIIATYGSSMGGFLSLFLSPLLNADCAFCLCPQSNLWAYIPSKKYLSQHGLKDSEKYRLSYLINNLQPNNKTKFFIHFYCCDLPHITGFYKEYIKINKEVLEKLDIKVVVENDIPNQCMNHVPIPRTIALQNITNFFDDYDKEQTTENVES